MKEYIKLKRRIVYRGDVYNAIEGERINVLPKVFDSEYMNGIHDGLKKALSTLANDVKDIPAADARPVKRGKWILDEDPHDGDCRCSACGVAIGQMHERNHGLLNALTGGKWWEFYKYCPICGAKMDGGAE